MSTIQERTAIAAANYRKARKHAKEKAKAQTEAQNKKAVRAQLHTCKYSIALDRLLGRLLWNAHSLIAVNGLNATVKAAIERIEQLERGYMAGNNKHLEVETKS